MANLSIGDVEKITGIKARTLRYREQFIPLSIPQKDIQGRRVYTIRDIQLLMRIDYLITKHGMTPGQAKEQLIRELAHQDTDLTSAIAQTKADLIRLYITAKNNPLILNREENEQNN